MRGRFRLLAVVRRGVIAVLIAALAVTGTGVAAVADAPAAVTPRAVSVAPTAISGSQFDPGNIISDALFYDRNAMTQSEIQSFLSAKIGSCSNSSCLNILRTTTFTRAADRTVCSQYTGAANELVSTIIYKVQQACGISAKVLLVTLQKEQGLITDRSPSATQIRIAMGYGCPDTAPCDSQFYGLYNQLYKAAWQLKRYSTPDRWGTYQPGVRSIGYHPNSACGAKSVNISNNATAALYNYTPYTPNAAALANLGGTGNSCSSYGNRNFWYFYTSWFGATNGDVGQTKIDELYTAEGGAAGYLGAAGASTCTVKANLCSQTFAGGTIYWGRYAGAWPVRAALDPAYQASGGMTGRLGFPIGKYVTVTGNPNGDGAGQQFQTGTIYSSASGTYSVYGEIRSEYWSRGSNAGAMGWPTTDYVCADGTNCVQEFQGGLIFRSVVRGTRTVADEYLVPYRANATQLGMPLGKPITVPSGPNGPGGGQSFLTGTIYTSAAGAFPVWGVVRAEYWRQGSNGGPFGWPTADPVCTGGLCSQQFQGGTITQTSSTTAISMRSAFASVHQTYLSSLGAPRGSYVDVASSPNGAGGGQSFASGTIYTSAAGTFPVWGVVRSEYWRLGSNAGAYGWPIAAPVCSAGLCSQEFQGGTITQTSSTKAVGTLRVYPDFAALHATYASVLGAPTTAYTVARPTANAPGGAQGFRTGTIYSSALGAYPLWGAIRTEYKRMGANGGVLGWPIAEPVCASGLCSQQFERGTITQTSTTAARTTYAVHAPYAAAYAGFSAQLGTPTTPYTTASAIGNGSGGAQRFTSGMIYSSAAGAYPVFGAVFTEYLRLKGHAGTLGWPTSDPVCGPSTCTQTFQRGTITK